MANKNKIPNTNHRMIICLLNRFIPLIQLRYVLSVKIYILPIFGTLYLDLSGSQRGLGLRGSGLKIAGLRGSGAPDHNKQGSRAPEKLIRGLQVPPLIIESVLVICYLRSDSRQTANKARYDATVCKNVRILIFGASGSAANVLRAPGSTVK